MNKIKLLIISMFSVVCLYAQDSSGVTFNTGLDFVTSYNWRAIDFGNSPALQPYIGISGYGIDFSIWGSYALIANETIDEKKVPFTEIDLTLRYTYEAEFGNLYTEFVDFYYPYLNLDYSNYDGVEEGVSKGAHWLSWAVGYKGPETFPVSAKVDYSIYNDPDKSIYFELGYGLNISDARLDLFLGFAKGKDQSSLYNIKTDKLEFVNIGGTLSKSIKITQDFSLPVSTTFVVNPRLNKAFLVFKASL